MRRVGDEILARAVGLLEPVLHGDERPGQLAQLIGRLVAHRFAELAHRDAGRGALQPRQPARNGVRGAPSDQARDEQGQAGGDEDPPFDQIGGRVDVANRL